MNLKDSYKIYKDNKDFENILIKISEIIAAAKKNAYYSKIDFTKDLFTIWDSLPIIDKTDLNKYTNLLDDEKGFKVYTTGSTGIPTQCIWTNYEYNKAMLSVLKKRIDNGYTKNTDIGNVEWSKSNGKLHQVITELIGRKNDYLILPNNDRIIGMYQQTKSNYIPLSQNKIFKPLKNIIIKEALSICNNQITFDDVVDENDEPAEANVVDKFFYENNLGLYEYQVSKKYLDNNSENYDSKIGIETLKKSANMGCVHSLYLLGKYYMDGIFLKKDLNKAEKTFIKADNMNNCYAQYRLSKIYFDSNGDLFNPQKGLEFLCKSASSGYKYALYQLGKIYYNGVFVEKDINKAIQYLMAAAEKDCECAEKLLEYINNNSKEWQSYTAILAVLNDLSKLFKKEFDNKYKLFYHIDRKTLQKINEKKQSMGLRI